MSDWTDSKAVPGKPYLEGELDSTWCRTEPLLTPDQLKVRYLFGLPLVSQLPDPLTKKRAILTDPILQELIKQAANKIEAELGIVLFETEIRTREPFDRALYNSFAFFPLKFKPMNRLLSLEVESSDGQLLLQVPPQWVELGGAFSSQLNIIPIALSTFPNGQLAGSPTTGGGSLYISILQGAPWVAAFWTLKAIYGWPENALPIFINDLIGVQAAIDILGMLGATFAKTQGASLAMDSLSQSFSGPGPNVYALRITHLQEEKSRLLSRTKMYFGNKLLVGNL